MGRDRFLPAIQRAIKLKKSTQYLTKEEVQIKASFKRPEYADAWLKLRREVFNECEEIIQDCISELDGGYPNVLASVARNIVRLTWPFAASESHHHPQMGGLPIHLCETMLSAIQIFKKTNTAKSMAVDNSNGKTVDFMQAENMYGKAMFSVCLAALAHDVGKVFDQQMSSNLPGINFFPLSDVPELWLAEQNLSIEHAKLHWLPERERQRHAIASIGILLNLLSPLMARKGYSDIVSSFMGEHMLVSDPNSKEIPTSNLSKMGTFMHMTNLAILHHNNMEYEEGTDNFVLKVLRQADADSSIEWEEQVMISFRDYFERYLIQELGNTIQVNAPAYMTVYARRDSKHVLMPIKRLHDGFSNFVDAHSKELKLDVDMMVYELVRQGFAPTMERDSIEPLKFEVTCPSILKGIVTCVPIKVSAVGIQVEPKDPDLGVFLHSSNLPNDDTLGMFYFTPPIADRVGKKSPRRVVQNDESSHKQEKKGGNGDGFRSFIDAQTTSVDDVSKAPSNPTESKRSGSEGAPLQGINIASIQTIKPGETLSVPDKSERNNQPGTSRNTAELDYPDNHPMLIDYLKNWIRDNKIGINDFAKGNTILLPQEGNCMYVKIRDPLEINPEIIDSYVKDLAKITESNWGDSYSVVSASVSKKGAGGGSFGDYLIKCPIMDDVRKKNVSRKGLRVKEQAKDIKLDLLLEYCGLK